MNQIIEKIKSLPQSFIINLGMRNKNNEIEKIAKLHSFQPNTTNNNLTNNHDAFSMKINPYNIIFKQENIIKEIKTPKSLNELYDVIFCLNTSKWIHLNFGDIGIKTLFMNIYNLLQKNGLFIFQFQNWKSYKNRRNDSLLINKHFNRIKLKPEKFEDYLQETYNFKLIKKIPLPNNSKKMFDRPIYVFQKIVY